MKKHILICGGDGFCGWPTSLYLSRHGYDVSIVDNFSRRKIDIDLGIKSLTPISSLETRVNAWYEISGKKLKTYNIDISNDYAEFLSLLMNIRPDVIIHFAEQRSAPYSMASSSCKRYTVNNNLRGTHNILCAIVESGLDIHLVHLGTMGVYGYETAGLSLPEGYLPVTIATDDGTLIQREIMYPPDPGSIYHMTKTQDALFFYFYNKNDKVRITDLHQGIVWGTETEETALDVRLINRFDYDGDYGTVLNRFLVQSVVGHPLTVHGSGQQTRAFIHIKNTVECLRLAVAHPPQTGERVRIFNQAAEVHTVSSLAGLVSELTGASVRYYRNPRNEANQNSMQVVTQKFAEIGLRPILLSEELLHETRNIVSMYKHRCNKEKIICTSLWNSDRDVDIHGNSHPVY